MPRDRFGNIEFSSKESFYDGSIFTPKVSYSLEKIYGDIQYPKDADFLICVSHDVDSLDVNYTKAERLRSVSHPIGIKNFIRYSKVLLTKHNYTDCFNELIDFEKNYGFRSSFMFQPLRYKQNILNCRYDWNDILMYRNKLITLSELIKELILDNFDIGLHGSFDSAICAKSFEDEASEISTMVNRNLITSRQHFLRFDPELTTRIIANSNKIKCDSTLGFNRCVGFRNGMSHPFYIFDRFTKKSFLEIPLIIQDGALFREDSLNLDLYEAKKLCKKIINEIKRTRGCVSILWHPHCLEKDYINCFKYLIDYIYQSNGLCVSLDQGASIWMNSDKSKIDIESYLCAE